MALDSSGSKSSPNAYLNLFFLKNLLEYKLYDVKIDGGADESEYLND
jgi:hypothetical protein